MPVDDDGGRALERRQRWSSARAAVTMNPYRSHLIEKEEEKGEAEEPETIKGNRSGKKEQEEEGSEEAIVVGSESELSDGDVGDGDGDDEEVLNDV